MAMGHRSEYLVVGAGSAGAVVAARLAAAGRDVTLLEAGRDHRSADTPRELWGANFLAACTERYLWSNLHGARTPEQPPRPYLRGRTVGGCSAVNAMVGLWPAAEDDADWPRPYHRDATAAMRVEIERRLPLERPPRHTWAPLDRALATAALDAGHAWCDDYHRPGAAGIGVGPAALTRRDGRRVSTNDGYLEPVRHHPNLSVWGDAEVAEVVLDGRRAVGVRLVDGRAVEAGTVVVAAGAIASPALLLRSGVRRAGIGQGLADHPSAPVTLLLRADGRLTDPDRLLVTTVLRYSSGLVAGPDGVADMQVMGIAAVGATEADLGMAVLQAAVMRSFGRGRVSLGPDGDTRIDFNLLADERDRLRLRDGLRRVIALTRHPAARSVIERVVCTGVEPDEAAIDALLADDEALDRWLAANTGDYVHACGTCRLGPATDAAAVVDPVAGAVHGYQGLHVIDASVFPAVPRANTHYCAVLVAEVMAAGLLDQP